MGDQLCICGHTNGYHYGESSIHSKVWRCCSGHIPRRSVASDMALARGEPLADIRCRCPRFRLGLGQASAHEPCAEEENDDKS